MSSQKPDNIHLKRIKKLQRRFSKEKIDGLLVTNLTNVRYLTGFISSSAQLIVSETGCVLMTDFRYIEAARKDVKFVEIFQATSEPQKDLKYILRKYKVGRLGFESSRVSYLKYTQLKNCISEKRLKPCPDIVERLRMIKEPGEIEAIRRAIRPGEKGFRYIRRLLRPGVKEEEIALELELFLKVNGAGGLAFDTVIAFGTSSAVPHYRTGKKKLRERDMVLIDWGVNADGYSSDLTRTLLSHSMTNKEKSIYSIVLEAQQKAIDKIRPGVNLAVIDRTARDVITGHGYAGAFGHSCGHGIGMEVHEYPGVSSKSKMKCCKGMVITAEPGIYIKGWGGVRIEDDILVTENGCEVLSRLSKKAEPF